MLRGLGQSFGSTVFGTTLARSCCDMIYLILIIDSSYMTLYNNFKKLWVLKDKIMKSLTMMRRRTNNWTLLPKLISSNCSKTKVLSNIQDPRSLHAVNQRTQPSGCLDDQAEKTFPSSQAASIGRSHARSIPTHLCVVCSQLRQGCRSQLNNCHPL